jgi:eukaryotic-like serine/threonine-protein kinase
MNLSQDQIRRMSRLLDEALPLDEAGRREWLKRLPAEHGDLAGELHEALLSAAPLPGDLPGAPLKGFVGLAGAFVSEGSLNPGARVGPYELIRLLGAGGMAEVWLARRADGAFKRRVALKLPLLTRRRQALEQRFAHERDILARLEHPNIARFYDAGVDSQGLPYFAMEYVQGETLLGWCDAHRLAIPERLGLLLQVLEAVSYAHEKHVIHRDIKPSNILVTQTGQVRLLDFGVAKLLQDDDPQDEPQLSRVYGPALTPDYASPESLGGAAVDARSDVYSLGMVLYELLTGTRPYRLDARSSIAALRQGVEAAEVPAPSTQVTPEASLARATSAEQLKRMLRGDLNAIVLKALAKEPAQRYDNAASLAGDLQHYLRGEPVRARSIPLLQRTGRLLRRNRGIVWFCAVSLLAVVLTVTADRLLMRSRPAPGLATAFTPPAHSVAVLPFANLSGDPQQDYFSDGVSEELINALSHVNALQVSARTSSFSFKGKNADIGTIARKLNVAVILQGSIRRSGNTVRIAAQLVNSSNGFHIWSQSYDRDLSDILTLQSDIASTVAREMRVRLLGDETARMEVGGTRQPQAYEAYLRGTQLERSGRDREALTRALAEFDRAIELDESFAAAHAQRAHALRGMAIFAATDPAARREFYAAARQAAERAIALAPDYADGHMVLGWHILLNGYLDFAGAAREIERAMALAPGSAAVLDGYAGFEGIIGHHEAALEAMRHAVRLDPENPRYREHLLANLSWARRFGDVHAAALDARARNAEVYDTGLYEALADLALGHPESALQTCQAVTEPPLLLEDKDLCLALAAHALGKLAEAKDALERLEAAKGDLGAIGYAAVYAQWGDAAAALRWLAVGERVDRSTLLHLKVDWLFDPIRSQPAFQALERRLEFPQ